MNLKQTLANLVSNAKGKQPTQLTQNEQYNIELLEERIMYSATQCGAFGADGGFDFEQLQRFCLSLIHI